MKQLLISLFFYNILFAQNNELLQAEEFQAELNVQFSDSLTSPLLTEDLQHFTSLEFYPISEKYIVEATFKKARRQQPFKMKTSTDRMPMYKKYGTLYFELEGKKMQLHLYQNLELSKKPGFENYLFLPFSDTTNGKETYIGGRYLDFEIPKSKKLMINFNKAYNPYCAYNYEYSCPIVPLENDLEVKIEAGVKKFHD